jgi:hypothetical protein
MEERRKKEGKGKKERRKREHLLNIGRGKLLIEAKGWRRRVWIVFWGVSLDKIRPRCMFALYMRRLVPYPNGAILRDSRIAEYSSSFVTFEDLLRQAWEQRIDP